MNKPQNSPPTKSGGSGPSRHLLCSAPGRPACPQHQTAPRTPRPAGTEPRPASRSAPAQPEPLPSPLRCCRRSAEPPLPPRTAPRTARRGADALRLISKSLLEQSQRTVKRCRNIKIKHFRYQRYLNNRILFLHSRSNRV